jgi:hypothetical protein
MILSYLSSRQGGVSLSGRGTSQDQQEVPEDAEQGNLMGGGMEPSQSRLENSHPPLIHVT